MGFLRRNQKIINYDKKESIHVIRKSSVRICQHCLESPCKISKTSQSKFKRRSARFVTGDYQCVVISLESHIRRSSDNDLFKKKKSKKKEQITITISDLQQPFQFSRKSQKNVFTPLRGTRGNLHSIRGQVRLQQPSKKSAINLKSFPHHQKCSNEDCFAEFPP